MVHSRIPTASQSSIWTLETAKPSLDGSWPRALPAQQDALPAWAPRTRPSPSPAADPAGVSCAAPSAGVSRRHQYRGWRGGVWPATGPAPAAGGARRGYFSIVQLGNACCSSATPAAVTLVPTRPSSCRFVSPLMCANRAACAAPLERVGPNAHRVRVWSGRRERTKITRHLFHHSVARSRLFTLGYHQ